MPPGNLKRPHQRGASMGRGCPCPTVAGTGKGVERPSYGNSASECLQEGTEALAQGHSSLGLAHQPYQAKSFRDHLFSMELSYRANVLQEGARRNRQEGMASPYISSHQSPAHAAGMGGGLSRTSCTRRARLPPGSMAQAVTGHWHFQEVQERDKAALKTRGMDMEEGEWTKVWAVALVWGWDGCMWGGEVWADLGRSLQPHAREAQPTASPQPRCCSTAISVEHEGQVRAVASVRAARRGLRLAGELGWGCGRDIISEQSYGRW